MSNNLIYDDYENSTKELQNSKNLSDDFQLNFLEAIKIILKRRSLIGIVVLSITLLTGVCIFLMPNFYTSHATILPSGNGENKSGAKQMMGFLGINAVQDDNSSLLYPTILASNCIKDGLMKKKFTFFDDSIEKTVTLQEYFKETNPDKLKGELDDVTSISFDEETGVIMASIETKYPTLSQAILEQYLQELESFNIHKRTSSAKNSVKFLTNEVENKKKELRQAENDLEAFQKANSNWAYSSDPALLKELNRLKQDIEIKLKTYYYLNNELESARIDAQKDVPVVVVLDKPSLPVEKSGPFRIKTILISMVFSFILMSFIVVVYETLRKHGIYVEAENIKIPFVNKNKQDDKKQEIKKEEITV